MATIWNILVLNTVELYTIIVFCVSGTQTRPYFSKSFLSVERNEFQAQLGISCNCMLLLISQQKIFPLPPKSTNKIGRSEPNSLWEGAAEEGKDGEMVAISPGSLTRPRPSRYRWRGSDMWQQSALVFLISCFLVRLKTNSLFIVVPDNRRLIKL